MKNGFLRLGLPIELDLFRASVKTLGTEIRVGLLRTWLDIGFRVTIYPGIKKKDQIVHNKEEE